MNSDVISINIKIYPSQSINKSVINIILWLPMFKIRCSVKMTPVIINALLSRQKKYYIKEKNSQIGLWSLLPLNCCYFSTQKRVEWVARKGNKWQWEKPKNFIDKNASLWTYEIWFFPHRSSSLLCGTFFSIYYKFITHNVWIAYTAYHR